MILITAGVIIIGNEILSGRTQDLNLAWIAKKFSEKGIVVKQAVIVADEESEIIKAVLEFKQKFTYVVTTGGIGPTHDDITAASIAKAFQRKFELNLEAKELLASHYGPDLTEGRLRMAMMPAKVTLIPNLVTMAPGFKIENVYVLAGIPLIAQAMLEQIIHELTTGPRIYTETLHTKTSESEFAKALGELQQTHPEVDIGSYPMLRRGEWSGVNLIFKAQDPDLLQQVIHKAKNFIQN